MDKAYKIEIIKESIDKQNGVVLQMYKSIPLPGFLSKKNPYTVCVRDIDTGEIYGSSLQYSTMKDAEDCFNLCDK